MKNYQTISYAAIDLFEMLQQLEGGIEPDMEQFFEAALLLFGADRIRKWRDEGDYDRIKRALQQNLEVFKDADTTGDGFISRLQYLHTFGRLVDRNGKNILETSEKVESTDVNMKKSIISDIAQVMDISETVAIIAMASAHRNIMEKDINA